MAEIHENANPIASTRSTVPTALGEAVLEPEPHQVADHDHEEHEHRVLPDVGRRSGPTSTAERAIGSERNRSMMPFFRSSASPTAVVVAPKIAFWTKMPGIRNST